MKYYTYIHYKADTNEPFYIGKGHSKRAYSMNNRNKWWHATVKKHDYKVEILSRFETDKEALDHEVFLIKVFRELGYKLCNLTDGGEGISGFKHSDEYKERCKQRTYSAETLKKMSLAKIGKEPACKFPLQFKIIATCIATGQTFEMFGEKHIKSLGFSSSRVYRCVSGEAKTHKNHTFKRELL